LNPLVDNAFEVLSYMKFSRLFLSSALIVATAVSCSATSHARRGPTSQKLPTKKSKSGSKSMGQRAIDDSRATQIQSALVKSGYLSNEAASGHWDSQTEAAMQKLQADNGWQTKLIPDSRAIIKLGLGPAHDTGLSTGTSSALAPPGPSVSVFSQQ
jgi:Putative peptidoglycan binding domain